MAWIVLSAGINLVGNKLWHPVTVNVDVKVKELCIMKLLNHILQPTMYEDIRTVAREWNIEDNSDKYLVSSYFCNTWR